MNLWWNFTATSHGKGPHDALGGGTNIGVLLMSPDDIFKECNDLGVDEVWKNLPVFKGTINTHLVEVTNAGLTHRWYRNHAQTMQDVGPFGQVTAADEPDQAPNINPPG